MTRIEWTEKTWNPIVGCSKVSPGCAHCYAETIARRLVAKRLTRSLKRAEHQAEHAARYAVRLRAHGRAQGLRLALFWMKQLPS